MYINRTKLLFSSVLLLIAHIQTFSSSYINQNNNGNDPIVDDVVLFLTHLLEFSEEIFTKSEVNSLKSCFHSLSNRDLINSIFLASGKELGDPGFETNCLKEDNLTYYLLLYDLTGKAFSLDDWEIISFLQRERNFISGICVNQGCLDVIPILQNSKEFHSFLDQIGISNLRINTTDILPPSAQGNYVPYQILLWLFIILFILMILAFCFSHIMTIEAKETIIKENKKSLTNSSLNDASSNVIIKTYNRMSVVNMEVIRNRLTNFIPQEDESITISNILKVLYFFSFGMNWFYLFQPSNMWFNESSLEFVAVRRFLFLCCISFNHTFYAFTKMIQEDFFSSNLYSTILFGIVKATKYGIDFSIVLDAFIMSYKLMWYLKKNCYDKNKGVSLKILLSFCLLLIPKIITFIFEYYFILLFSPNLACDLNTTPYRLFYHDTVSTGKKDCEKRSWLIFIPFYLQYVDYISSNKDSLRFTTCFRYCLIYQNELLCCLFFLLLIYIINIIRSRLFDCMIGLVVILGLCLTCVDFMFVDNRNDNTTFDYYYYLGQTFTLKYTHMFIHIYMLGALSGVVYFYHKDSISSRPISFGDSNYYPFAFCFKMMQIINNLNRIGYYLINIFWWIMLSFLSLSYYFYRLWYNNNYEEGMNKLKIPINTLMRFLYYYDRPIIVFCFLVYLLLQCIKTKSIFINYLGAFKLMIIVSRVSFSSLFCADTVIYMFLIGYDFDSIMSYSDCFVLTIGVMFVNLFVCILMTVIIEMPLRVLSKIAMRKLVSDDISKEMNINSLAPILSN